MEITGFKPWKNFNSTNLEAVIIFLMHKHNNQLIHETSPYLLQHAHNPVNWYPWGDKALAIAKQENKPILVSIGYSACHWCHVMERESFELESTAAIMNEHFINIKIDREERPDLDHIYMDALQAMTGSGGWPLNVFLTPDGKPFYGGTYFPPKKAFNRPSWHETILGVAKAFTERRHEIDAQAENLTEHLVQSNAFGIQKLTGEEIFAHEKTDEAFQNIMKSADKEWGGFGKAPKFPQTFSILYLLRYSYSQNTPEMSESSKPPLRQERGFGGEALKQALLSLDKMIEGGIYDQVGGGFSRYSTDTEWLAPHFEKMLYDNALLISVLSEAYQLTKKERYKEVIEETMHFIASELMDSQMGFYASLDADSEGVEGKFYVWEMEEVKKIVGKDADIFCEYYEVTLFGNWEEKNILRVKKSFDNFAVGKNITVGELKKILKNGRQKLLEQREKRIRPPLDDKIILSWNALMNTACSKAFAATGHERYRQLAIKNMQFMLERLATKNPNEFHHTWKNGTAKFPAFLDDYAFLIEALLHLQEITGDHEWLLKAKRITAFVMKQFSETETESSSGEPGRQAGFFFYTPIGQLDVIIRKKEMYDGAVPSGNSVMAYNLYRLSILLDKNDWKKRSMEMVSSMGNAIARYPTSFGNWVCLLQEMITGTHEITLVGAYLFKLHKELLQQYIPHRVLMVSGEANPGFPLLTNKPIINKALFYLCRNNTCHPPVISAKELISLINNPGNR